MHTMDASTIALIVSDEKRALAFEKTFFDLLEDKTKPTLKAKLNLERFKSVGEFLKAQRDRKNLAGTVVDMGLISDSSDTEKRALALLEELQIPMLKASEKMLAGDAVDRKILTGKWMQLMDQVEAFAPRGLRVHTRKLCYIKIRYVRPVSGAMAGTKPVHLESRAITYDLSKGGCFIVSMEDWAGVDTITVFVGDYPHPIDCRIAWRLPWGASNWKMPGIGVEFVSDDANLKNYLLGFLSEG
jgi:Tfp pilus assembly protein PilZ